MQKLKVSLLRHKRIILYAAIGFLVLIVVGVLFSHNFRSKVTLSPLSAENNAMAIVSEKPLSTAELADKKTLGILLLGYGGGGHEGAFLTDAIQVLLIDFEKATITLISIPRDLWIKQPNGHETKINATMIETATDKTNLIKSGASQMKSVITSIIGVKLDYFVGIDFVGYQRAIGANLKGIEVNVSETLDDPWYPVLGEELNTCGKTPEEMTDLKNKYSGFDLEKQYACRYKHLHFEKGLVSMQGGEALEYARSRHGSSEGDVARGKRQQEVLAGVEKKLFTLDALSKLPTFYNDISKNTETDIDINVIQYLVPTLQKAKDFRFQTINLSPSNVLQTSSSTVGGAIMIPKDGMFKWGGVRDFISQQLKAS